MWRIIQSYGTSCIDVELIVISLDISSHRSYFIKKCCLERFAKFKGKHLCQSLFFNKVAGLRLQLYLKRDSGTGVFFKFCEIFENTFFIENLRATASAWTSFSTRRGSCMYLEVRTWTRYLVNALLLA